MNASLTNGAANKNKAASKTAFNEVPVLVLRGQNCFLR